MSLKIIISDEGYEIPYLMTVFSQYLDLEQDKLIEAEKDIFSLLEGDLPGDLMDFPTRDIEELYNYDVQEGDYKKINQKIGEKTIEKCEQLGKAMMEDVFAEYFETHKKEFNAYINEYEQYLDGLDNETDESVRCKKAVLKKFKDIDDEKKTSYERVKILAELYESSDSHRIVSVDRNYWWHFLAVFTILPAIILAIRSNFYSSKKTYNFFKSHGEIFYEKVSVFGKSFRNYSPPFSNKLTSKCHLNSN